MQNRITEFFQFIYVASREDVPEFLVVAHEFKVRHALRGNVDTGTVELMAKENAYGQRIITLEQNFYKVSGIIANTPEPLQPAMLRVLGGSVTQMLMDMEVPPEAASAIMGELDDILNDYKDITTEQLQAAQELLAQILAANAAAQSEENNETINEEGEVEEEEEPAETEGTGSEEGEAETDQGSGV